MSTTTVAEIAEHYLSSGRVRKGDVPFLLSEIERRIPWPPDAATVERMAGVLHQYHHIAGCDCSPTAWTAWTDEARAVLDALGGGR